MGRHLDSRIQYRPRNLGRLAKGIALTGLLAGAYLLQPPPESIPVPQPTPIIREIAPPDTIELVVHDTLYRPLTLNDGYVMIVTDTPQHPFVATVELYNKVNEVTDGLQTPDAKARAIFDWVEGLEYRNSDNPVRSADKVFQDQYGKCSELAYLYIVSARLAGIDAHYARVQEDYNGKQVLHGCASVTLDDKILVDPAYHTFDIKHKKFQEISDEQAVELFRQWSGKTN